VRLKDRNRQIPGGFRYYQPETRFFPTPWSSFDSCVAQIIAHRQGNLWLVERNGWSLDPAQVSAELDAFNTKLCAEMNWMDYLAQGDPGSYSAPVYTDANPPGPPPRQLATKCCGAK
jgi:hypothetical protein